MNTRRYRFLLASLTLTAGLASLPDVAAGQTYRATDLGTLGGSSTYGQAINNAGQVVGYSTNAAGTHRAFLWSGGALSDLGTLGGSSGKAFGINNSGQVVGSSALPGNSASHATLWTNGTITDLGTLIPPPNDAGAGSQANAINDAGQVVGAADSCTSPGRCDIARHAFIHAGGVMTDIGTSSQNGLSGWGSAATAINNAGQITGHVFFETGMPTVVFWSSSTSAFVSLFGAGPLRPGGADINGVGINSAGQVVATALGAVGVDSFHALMWDRGAITDLGALYGSCEIGPPCRSGAIAINASGQVVGFVGRRQGTGPVAPDYADNRAALWSNGGVFDLNTLLDPGSPISPYVLRYASAINDSGLIVAVGYEFDAADPWKDTGVARTFLLSPVTVSLTVSPTSLSFGSQPAGTSATRTLTVTNTGSTSVGLNVAITGDYAQTNNCGTALGTSASCTIEVQFTPTTPGTRTGAVTISSGGASFSAGLTGVGTFAASLTASAANVLVGTPVTLTWASAPGATCTATDGTAGDGWTGTLPASGSQAVSESASGSYTYGVTCTGGGETSQAQVTVSMGLPTVTLSAAPTTVTVGQTATLTWSSTFATACTASGGGSGDGWTGTRATSGSASVTEHTAATYTYTLVCSGGGQLVQAQAVVTVRPAPKNRGGGGATDAWLLFGLAGLGFARRRRLMRA